MDQQIGRRRGEGTPQALYVDMDVAESNALSNDEAWILTHNPLYATTSFSHALHFTLELFPSINLHAKISPFIGMKLYLPCHVDLLEWMCQLVTYLCCIP